MATWLVAALASISAVSLALTLATHAAVRRVLARRPPGGGPTPPISILKPLKGLDDGLFENLASFAGQRYPQFEILLGTPDRNDPALDLVPRLRAAFPDVPISVLVCERRFGRNPKVSTLACLAVAARHEHLLVSDSNVRVGPDYLRETVAEFADPRVGLVTSPIAATGERNLGAVLENAHLNGFIAGTVCGAALFARRVIVLGKSMLFRRRDLEALGGFWAVRHVLAEDYVLGRRFEAAGFRIALSPHVIATVNETWSLGRFANRHVRWGQLRRRLSPAAYLAEPLLNPVPWLTALLGLAVAGAALGPLSSAALAAAAAAGVAAKLVSDALVVRRLRGEPMRPVHLALIPVKDLLVFAFWVVAAFRRHVNWRGSVLRIGSGSRLLRVRPVRTPLPASRRAPRVPRAGAAR